MLDEPKGKVGQTTAARSAELCRHHPCRHRTRSAPTKGGGELPPFSCLRHSACDRPVKRRAGVVEDRQSAHDRRYRVPGLAACRQQRGTATDRGILARHREVARRGTTPAEGGRRRGADLRAAEPQRPPALQIHRDLADRRWSKFGLHVTQHVLPTGPFFDAPRNNAFDVTVDFNCQGLVNPLMDVGKFLPHSVYTKTTGTMRTRRTSTPIRR
jgi:hypothetical protein